ncbi:MAG: LamG-like jellyroll fold domain-containing protein [Planctomycetota bacterium]
MTRFFTTASLIAVSLSAAQASADLVNHWTFDGLTTGDSVAPDTAGAVANDATWANVGTDGGGNPTTVGLAFDTPGISGGAARFGGGNAANRFFTVDNVGADSMEIEGTTAMTISMWINPLSSQAGGATGIFTGRNSDSGRGTTTFSGNQFWGIGYEEFNSDDRRIRGDSTGTVRSTAVFDGTDFVSDWIHIMWTWEGDGAVDPAGVNDPSILYINGVLDTTATINSDIYYAGTWLIGGDPLSGNNRNYGGLLDDLAVFDEALTADDALAIYQGGLAGQNVAQVIPEPSSLALLGLGGLLIARRRRG